MFSAKEYWDRVVIPSAEDFYAENRSVRLAFHACSSTLHTIDYVLQNRESDADSANRLIGEITKEAV